MNAKKMNRFNGTAALTVTITSELKTHFLVEQALNVHNCVFTQLIFTRFWSLEAFSVNQIEFERMEDVLLYFSILKREICTSGPRSENGAFSADLVVDMQERFWSS